MSLKAMAWAIEQVCGSPSAKVTLWSIANHVDKDNWIGWPSQDSISGETEQSKDSVQRRIPELEKLELVRRVPLRFAGRRSVDLYILPPSPYWTAHLDEIEPLLPRRFEIDKKFRHSHAAAICGSDKKGTSDSTLPQPQPQSAAHAAALVRLHEPVLNRRTEERDARTREEDKPKPLRIAPVLEYAAREARFEQFLRPVDQGGYPPEFIDSVEAARRAWAQIEESEWEAAIEAVPRFLRARARSKRGPVGLIVYIREQRWKDFPPPKSVDGRTLDTTVSISAFGRSAWVLFARQYRAGKSVRDQLQWIRTGAEIQASAEPTEAEERELVPVMIGSEQHVAWRDHCKRLGFDLPMPSRDVPIFLLSEWPPPLKLNWKSYRLIESVRIEIRSAAWWWRAFRPGAPLADFFTNRGSGFDLIDMGPLPLPSEVDDMVHIKVEDAEFEDWDLWLRRQGVTALWRLSGPFWAPSRKPPSLHEPVTIGNYEELPELVGGRS